MKPNVRYYPTIFRMMMPGNIVYRAAVITGTQELSAANFPAERALHRFLVQYKGPNWETFYRHSYQRYPVYAEFVEGLRADIIGWLEKKMDRRSRRADNRGALIELSMDFRTQTVKSLKDWVFAD